MKNIVILFISGVYLLGCSDNQKVKDSSYALGELQHQFTISNKAESSFEKGLLLLHSFEYEDSREAFQQAISEDASEIMGYWGEAMTHYQALWGLQDVEKGRLVLSKLGENKEERLTKISDPLEMDFWLGVEILYGEGELKERNSAYARHMGELYEKYPANQEVAAFYALALMWAEDTYGDDREISSRVASGILQENPNHPGALHYMIHIYDHPDYADNAQEAADLYSKVAPDATHALHMPSHIYLALGMWNDVVASNEISYAASVRRMERKELSDASRGFHSFAWLHYGYLQQNRLDKATELLKDMYVLTEKAGTPSARGYLLSMQNAQIVTLGYLPDKRAPMSVQYDDLGLRSKAMWHMTSAFYASKSNDALKIKQETDTLEIHIEAARLLITDEGVAMCAAGPTRYAPTKFSIIEAEVVVEEMKALYAQVSGDAGTLEAHLKKAVSLEDQLPPPVGPPDVVLPSYEMYGQWLLENGRAEEALDFFNKSLKRTPNRLNALQGKLKALKNLAREQEALEAEQLIATFASSDPVS
jgi:tetratricopeptide (TPR) repeat protein